jgi:hypothetical protein
MHRRYSPTRVYEEVKIRIRFICQFFVLLINPAIQVSFKNQPKSRIFVYMNTIDFDKFDLDGLSLEDIDPVKADESKSNKKLETDNAIDTPENNESPAKAEPEQTVELVEAANQADNTEEQMTCPKCELQQIKADQCSGCGVYVEKALAQIGQSNIQITASKF